MFFLTTVAFHNTYPKQPYTFHALHALSWLKRALLFGSGNSLSDTGGANDGKKGTQQRSIKVSGRHRQTIETQQHYHQLEKNGSDTTKGEGTQC